MYMLKGGKLPKIANFSSIFAPVFVPVFTLVFIMGFSGCQDGALAPDTSPFNSNIVRLGDTIVAEVDNTRIYLSDIEHAALAKGLMKPGTSLTPSDPLFQSVLDELIDQRLLAFEAYRRSLDKNSETQKRLSAAQERILSNVVVESILAEKVTEEAIRRIYDEQSALHEGGEQVWARLIVVADEKKAVELADLLDKGGDFARLAKEYSIDNSTRDLGGSLSWFAKNSMPDPIATQAFSTKIKEVSAPFKSDMGWNLLKVEGRRSIPKPKFEDIKAEIKSFMTYDEIEKLLRSLRANSNIALKLTSTNTEAVPKDGDIAPIPEHD